MVKFYDAHDPNFGYLDSIDITVNGNDREAVGIDFYNDGQGTKYLYTGAWMHGTYHNYLVRTDINDVNNPVSTQQYLGYDVGAIGIAVDQATGYIYITTSNNYIEVYNNATFPSNFLVKKKIANEVTEAAKKMNVDWHSKADAGCYPLTSCIINDCLEKGLDFDRGGARYNWVENSFVGLANLVDGLWSIKKLVYDKNELSLIEFRKILEKKLCWV